MLFLTKAAALVIFLNFLCVQIPAYRIRRIRYTVQETRCMALAHELTTKESNENDISFFKLCFADYFGFKIRSKRITVVPHINMKYFSQHGRRDEYMKLVTKRVERFFIRNGNWIKLLENRIIFNPRSSNCRNILYIVAVKYIYALYVLNRLKDQVRCNKCIKRGRGYGMYSYKLRSQERVCFIKPESFTCAQEIELMLLGHQSGTLTALFNQYFREPIGEDRNVPGFKEDSDILMGVRISAFHLEYAGYLSLFNSDDWHYNIMLSLSTQRMKESTNMKLLAIVVAIFKMKSYSTKYFNELLSDQSPMRSRSHLAYAFQRWSVEMASFEAKIKSFMESPHYNSELNYRRRNSIAFELVTGRLEASDIPSSWISHLADNAMSLIYRAPVYLTPGAVRHSIIEQRFNTRGTRTTPGIDDYWHSMLENWAMANRMYRRCVENNYKIRRCLLSMSKSLYLMFEAMCKIRPMLKKMLKSGAGERLGRFEDVLKITRNWVVNYRDKGYVWLPKKVTPKSLSFREESLEHKMTNGFPPADIDEEEPLDEFDDFEWPELTESMPDPVVQPLGKDVEDSVNLHTTKSRTKDVEDAHKGNPLSNDVEGSHKAKTQDKNIEESEGLQMENEKNKNDEWSDIHMTNSPEFLDLAETEELRNVRKYVTPYKVNPLYVDVDAPAVSPGKRSLLKEGMEKPLNDDRKTAGSTMVEPENEEHMKNEISPMVEPLDKNIKMTADSSKVNAMDMNDNQATGTSMEKSLNERTKETAGSQMTEALQENRDESVSPPMKESLGKVSPQTEPQNHDLRDTAGPAMEKLQDNDIKDTAGSRMEKPLDNEMKETAGSQIEKLPHDDFIERANPPPIQRKGPGKRLSANKTSRFHPKFYTYRSTFRRRSYTYRAVSNRPYPVYAASRRRRSTYARRRRITPKPRKTPSVKISDEMESIMTFLRRFKCYVRPVRVWRQTLTERCMDKIHRRVRKFNRVAFSYAAKNYKDIVIPQVRTPRRKKPRQDATIKTEL